MELEGVVADGIEIAHFSAVAAPGRGCGNAPMALSERPRHAGGEPCTPVNMGGRIVRSPLRKRPGGETEE
jgi:hypothetical protein